MLKVFTVEHQAQAHLVEDLLRSNGIEAHVVAWLCPASSCWKCGATRPFSS